MKAHVEHLWWCACSFCVTVAAVLTHGPLSLYLQPLLVSSPTPPVPLSFSVTPTHPIPTLLPPSPSSLPLSLPLPPWWPLPYHHLLYLRLVSDVQSLSVAASLRDGYLACGTTRAVSSHTQHRMRHTDVHTYVRTLVDSVTYVCSLVRQPLPAMFGDCIIAVTRRVGAGARD